MTLGRIALGVRMAVVVCLLSWGAGSSAQVAAPAAAPYMGEENFSKKLQDEAKSRERGLISEVRETELQFEIEPRASKIIRTKKPVARMSITHPSVLEIVQFSPTEFEAIGLAAGETSFTLWFAGPNGASETDMLRYQVRVAVNDAMEDQRRMVYAALERKVNELFPNSMVHLFSAGNKLIVRGQARDTREAGDIINMLRGEVGDVVGGFVNRGAGAGDGYGGYGGGGYGGYGGGAWTTGGQGSVDRSNRGRRGGAQVINMLEVPGEKLIMLKVRVAELSRSALRDAGSKLKLNFGDFSFNSSLGLTGAVSAVLSTEDLQLTLEALATNSYSKVLAEPNLVTLSGHSARFIVGGSFAVPQTVGVQGAAAVTTNFQPFGTELTFTPTVLDKDRIRLQVNPSFSNTDKENTVNGIPGLSQRAVETTVDLREGQWLAIAGLVQDQQEGSKVRVPGLGDIPVLDMFFSKRHVKRDETELLVLVSPELIHPLEPEEAPLILPGMEVTEPSDCAFYLAGDWEGRVNQDYRSTVAPVARRQSIESRNNAMQTPGYQATESRYIQGPYGFSQ